MSLDIYVSEVLNLYNLNNKVYFIMSIREHYLNFKYQFNQLKTHKDYVVLVLIALAGFCFALFSFYPGFLNLDSVNQLQQAQGKAPLTDWHPPAMALLWRLLILLTGSVSSLLVFQLLFYWLAFGAIAVAVRKQTGSIKLSLLPFVIAILPSSIIISGFYLKDVLMTSLLCLVAALLYIGSYTKKKTRLSLLIFITSTILIIYSGVIRYNVLLALAPLAYAASYNFFSNNRKTLLATIAMIAIVPVSIRFIEVSFNVQMLNGTSGLMIDDIKSILTKEEIRSSNLSSEAINYVLELKDNCSRNNILSHSVFLCSSTGLKDFRSISMNEYENIKVTWVRSVLEKPLTYIKFRMAVFWRFILMNKPPVFFVHRNGLSSEPINEQYIDLAFAYLTNEELKIMDTSGRYNNIFKNILQHYSTLSSQDFGIIYRTYFWLIVGIVLAILHRLKLSRLPHTYPALALLLSGLIYFLSYIPVVMSLEFRFIYWTTLSTGMALVIFIAEYFKSKNNLRSALQDNIDERIH